MTSPLLSGSTIGVFGSGQLGRMLAFVARRMGYHIHTFSPDSNSPTGQIADLELVADYHDPDAVRAFVQRVDVVTFEFENVPASVAQIAAEHNTPVRPGGWILQTAQQRLREKQFLANAGLPVAPFRHVATLRELQAAVNDIGTPAVLKTVAFGYDGKGQARIDHANQTETAWTEIGQQEAILEAFVDFTHEVSIVGARTITGEITHFPLMENIHRNHILDLTIAPARLPPEIETQAVELAYTILEQLDVVGVLCVEFFLARDGALLVNEIAPRPHNSGHLTVDAAITCQFEQQLRAVCGLPLGSTRLKSYAVMANLLGDLWLNEQLPKDEPDWYALSAFPNVKLHLYGKEEPRPGRKMGHLTALGDDVETALQTVQAARNALTSRLSHPAISSR